MNGTATDLPVGQSGDLFRDSRRSAFARGKVVLLATPPSIRNALFGGSAPDSESDAGYRRYKIGGRLRGGSKIGFASFQVLTVAKSLSRA